MVESVSQSRTQNVYQQLRDDMLSCVFVPGQRLRIAPLAKAYSVNPGMLREALSRLTAEGLIESTPQKGFKVTDISPNDLMQLSSAQSEIESLCLRRAIERGDLEWESRLVAAHYQLVATPQTTECAPQQYCQKFVQAYYAFKSALVAACDNQWLGRMRDTLNAQSVRYQLLSTPTGDDIAAQYKPVIEATLARNADLACSLLTEVIQRRAQASGQTLQRRIQKIGRA
jgi:DNA-binding GntR family transcriptional regulator